MKPVIFSAFSALLILTASPTFAATIHVPMDQATIQAGIDAAQNDDLVLVAPGTYQENIRFGGKTVLLKSEAGYADTVIIGATQLPIVRFIDGEGPASVLTGFTITAGFSANGAGISIVGASPTIKNNLIQSNIAFDIAEAFGAGIYCSDCSAAITNNIFMDNICLNSLVRSTKDGKALHGANGAGVYLDLSGAVVANNLFIGNLAEEGGGAIHCEDSAALIMNNTIVENEANEGAGLFVADSPSSVFVNNIVVDSPGGEGIFCLRGVSPAILNNDVWNNAGGPYGGLCPDLTGTSGNISEDPLFVDALADDYHLGVGSPCIDAANPSPGFDDTCFPPSMGTAVGDLGAYGSPGACRWDCWDVDTDGYGDTACGGEDCDDADPAVNPEAEEDCGNGIDEDCDGLIDGDDPDCPDVYTLELVTAYGAGTLSLLYTIGTPEPTVWLNYLILTVPSVQVTPLWTLQLPVVQPPIQIPVSLPLAPAGAVGIWTALYAAGVPEAVVLKWTQTGP